MPSISEVADKTKTSVNYRDNFAQFLIESERSAYTIKNYLCDLDGFALWLKSKGNPEFTPELITPADLREYKLNTICVASSKKAENPEISRSLNYYSTRD